MIIITSSIEALTVFTVVSNASWTPLYDVRASIAKSPEESSTVALHYRASITQTTGENWPDVALTLSTASPQVGSEVPSLSAWRIGFPPPPVVYMSSLRGGSAAPRRRKESARATRGFRVASNIPLADEDSDDDVVLETMAAATSMVHRQAEVVSAGVLSATFGISGRSDIPSDKGSHKVVIAVLDLQAELEWICLPREKESVFLRVSSQSLSRRK